MTIFQVHRFWFSLVLFCCTLSVQAQNVLISAANNPNEPSIMLDPKNPSVMVAATNINNYYWSTDSGKTWSYQIISSTHGVWGDPSLAVDTSGHFYFFHLSDPSSGSWIDRIVCQKSTDGGQSWNNGSYAGLNGKKVQDKEWFAVDRNSNNIYITWTQFDSYGSTNLADSSVILFSKSTNAGDSWSVPVRINLEAGDCLDDDNTVEGAVPTVGANGEIYVAWAGKKGLVFNRSLDEGKTWLKNEIPIANTPGGWNYDISGIYRSNGLPSMQCDLSHGPNHGTIYINWTDQRNGANNTDVFLSSSKDGGDTWTPPVRVNDDSGAHQQFLSWMTLDQATGYLYFVFYDRRNYHSDSTDVYIAISRDGGKTFINHQISESPFLPDAGAFFGDYTNIAAHNGVIRPIWTRLNKGVLSVWTDLTQYPDTSKTNVTTKIPVTDLSFENYPNPAGTYIFSSFKLRNKALVQLGMYDLNGKLVATIIHREMRDPGKYVERIDVSSLSLRDGEYMLQLEVNHEVKSKRQVIIK